MNSKNMIDLYRSQVGDPSSEDREKAQEIAAEIELNPDIADETFFSHTETNVDSRPQVFLLILFNQPEQACRIIENVAEDDYILFCDAVMALYPVEICAAIFENILTNTCPNIEKSNINVPLLLFANSGYLKILEALPEEIVDLLSNFVTRGTFDNLTVSNGLVNTVKSVGLGTFVRITQRIQKKRVISFIHTHITCSCQVQKLKDLLNSYIEQSVMSQQYTHIPFISPPEGTVDSDFSDVINDYIEYLEHIAPENLYYVFSNESGLYAELLPQLFSYIFYQNRKVAYKILKNIRGYHRDFSRLIFKKLSSYNKKYMLERSLIENTQGNQRSKIELTEILVYSREKEIINNLSTDCIYKLFVHFVRDYYEIDNTAVQAEILVGFEHAISGLSLQKLKKILPEFKSKNFIRFFMNIPVCKDILDLLVRENKIIQHSESFDESLEYPFIISKKDTDMLAWIRRQDLSSPVTTIDIIDTLETILQNYLAEISALFNTIPPKKRKKRLDTNLAEIIDEYFIPFKNAASLEQSALWFEFHIKIEQLRQDMRNISHGDVNSGSEIISDYLLIDRYFNNFFAKILNEKILIRNDSVEIEPIFLPEDFAQITGRVKVIELKSFQNEEDTAIYYRQFKYLKPSNLAIVFGFPADYSSTGKAGAIITGALADRDQHETAHSYKRAMEIGSPLAFFPNARIAFQHLDDKWMTIYKSDHKIYLRASTRDEIDKRIQETKKPLTVKSVAEFIPDLWPELDIIDCWDSKTNVSHQAGQKSEMLGRLINLFPNETETDSFTWSFAPYAKKRKFATIEEMPQVKFIERVLKSHDLSDHSERNKAAQKINKSFSVNPLDITTTYYKELWDKIEDTFGYSDTITQGFMIRLTMNLEDRPEISAAGVYSSLPVLPGISKKRLAQLINELYKSVYSPKAIEIRELMNISHTDTYAAVLFERMPNWKNAVLSGNLIVNSEHVTGGFVIGHGFYLMDKGNRPSLVFNYSVAEKGFPISIQMGQEYKKIPQNDYKNPYAQVPLTKEETDILNYPEDQINASIIDTINNNNKLIRKHFGEKTSWDIELTIEFEKDNQKIRIHQIRPIVK